MAAQGRGQGGGDREAIDRLRRIETRMTGFMQWMGYNTGTDKPIWRPEGHVIVPTPGASIRDVLAAIPDDWPVDEEVEIHHNEQWIASIMKAAPTEMA